MWSVDLMKTGIVLWAMSETVAKLNEGDIVNLSYHVGIVSIVASDIGIAEEKVGMHVVGPYIALVIAPLVALAVDDSTGDQELLEGEAVELGHTVEIPVALERRGHDLGNLLLIAVVGLADRSLVLREIDTADIVDQTTDEVVLERDAALLTDIVLLAHPATPAIGDGISPLIAIAVTLVSLTVLAELAEAGVILHGLEENVKTVAIMHLVMMSHGIHALIV